MSDKVSVNVGTTILGLLGVLFVALKLTGYINWSWVWVLAPFWAPLAIVVAVFVVIAIMAFVSATISGVRR